MCDLVSLSGLRTLAQAQYCPASLLKYSPAWPFALSEWDPAPCQPNLPRSSHPFRLILRQRQDQSLRSSYDSCFDNRARKAWAPFKSGYPASINSAIPPANVATRGEAHSVTLACYARRNKSVRNAESAQMIVQVDATVCTGPPWSIRLRLGRQ